MRKLIPYAVLTCCVFVFLLPAISQALTARDKYAVAESCYNRLRSNVKKMKYRDNWLRCIDKFQGVYKKNPQGSWAAAGMYMSGQRGLAGQTELMQGNLLIDGRRVFTNAEIPEGVSYRAIGQS